MTDDTTADAESMLENIGAAFTRLRRRTMQVVVDGPVAASDVRRDLLLTVIEELDGQLNVNGAAAALSMERSAASRLVGWCVHEALLERVASQSDGRSVTLRLTDRGRAVLAESRRQQRQAFDVITSDWDPRDRVEFARLLHKYVASAADASGRSPSHAG